MFALSVLGTSAIYGAIDQPQVLRTTYSGKDLILQKICQSIGPLLSAKNGPMGLGVFESVDCSGSTAENFFAPLEWRLNIQKNGDRINLRIDRKSDSKFMTLSETTIAHTQHLEKVLEQSDLPSLLALSLLDQLPYAGIANEQELKQKRITTERPSDPTWANYFRNGIVYSVETDSNDLFMVPSVLGEAALKQSAKGKTAPVFWSLTKMNLHEHHGSAWFHSASGPGILAEKLEKEISEKQTYWDQLASKGNIKEEMQKEDRPWEKSYAGMRLGMSILSSHAAIKKQMLIGLDLQHKSSWGGRVDMVAKTKGKVNGIENHAGWSRFLVEKQIVHVFKTDYTDAILLRPHAGLMSFDGKFPDEQTFMNQDFVTYKYSNMFTFGGSAIAAKYFPDYQIYAGYTLDFSFKNFNLKRPFLLAHKIDAEFRYIGFRNLNFLPQLLRDPYLSAFYQMDVFSIYGSPQFSGDTGGTLSYASNFIGGGLGFVF